MTDPNIKKLFRASKAASAKQIQHVMLTVSPNGKVHVSGADNLVATLLDNVELFSTLETSLQDNYLTEVRWCTETHTSWIILFCHSQPIHHCLRDQESSGGF